MLEHTQKSILLVEDEFLIAMSEKMELEKYGYAVKTATNGECAIDFVETSTDIDLILMDINLGDGIDGTEAAEIILKKHEIPIVFVSSHTEREVVEKTEKITSYGYVVKSSSVTVLDASIKMAFKLFDANKVIKNSEEKQKTMISNISDVIAIIGVDGIMKYKSPNIEKWFGWKPEDLIGTDGWETVHPDDLERIKNEFYKLLEKDYSSTTVQYLYKCKDESYKPIELTATNLTKNTQIAGILLNYHDITERRKIEKKLVESEEKYRISFKTSPDSVNINTMDGLYVEINQGFTSLTGYTNQDVIGKLSSDIRIWSIPEDREKLVKGLREHGYVENLESVFRCKDGSLKNALMSARVISLNNQPHILSVTRDITERKRAEKALREIDERFDLAINASNDGLFDWNLETNRIYYSPRWKSILGYEDHEIPNDFSVWETATEPEDVKRSWELQHKLIAGQIDRFAVEFKMKHKHGHWVDILSQAKAVFDKNGKAVRMVGTHTDITDRKRAEEALRESEEKYRLLFLNMNSYNSLYDVVTDKEGKVCDFRFVMVNSAYEKYVGKSASELVGKTLLEVYPSTEQFWIDKMSEVASTGMPNQFASFSKVMNTHTEINLFVPQKGQLAMTTGNIDKRKLIEDELRESKQKAEMLLNVAAEIIISLDSQGDITLLNESGHRILGYESPELVGKNWFDTCLPEENRSGVKDYFWQLKNGKSEVVVAHENVVITKTGELKTIHWHNAILKNNEGVFIGLFSSGEDVTERKKAEEKLGNSEEKYRILIQNSHDIIYTLTADGVFLFVSPAWTTLLGHPEDQVVGSFFEQFVHSDDVAKCQLFLKRVLETGKRQEGIEYRVRHINGSWRWHTSNAVPLRNETGTVFGFEGLASDITERKIAEETLRASEVRFRNMLQDVPNISVQGYGPDGTTRYWNKTSEQLYGYTAQEAIGRNFIDLIIPPEMRGEVEQAIKQMAETGQQIPASEMSLMCKDGSRVSVFSNHAIVQIPGQESELYCIDIDITEHKKAEEALRVSRDEFKIILASQQDLMVKTDTRGCFLFVNPAYCATFGKTEEELIGTNYSPLVHPDDLSVVENAVAQLFAPPFTCSYNERASTVDGWRWFSWTAKSVLDENGNVIAFVGSGRDITEQKLAEDKIIALLIEKDLLLKEINHRVKNNMNTVSSLLSLQAQVVKEPSAVSALQEARGKVQSMSILYDKLYQSADFTELSLKDYLFSLVDDVLENFPNYQFVKVEKHIDDFLLDAKRLQPLGIIINELLTNIMKYAFTGKESGLIIVRASSSEGHVAISVQDDGNGIPESVSFENSTGFGLQLVHALTGQLEGTIRIERENGTKVVLEFPL